MLDVHQQLKILLLHLRQAPGGELAVTAFLKPPIPTRSGKVVEVVSQLDWDLLFKVANHLQKSQFVEIAKTGGLTERDFERLQWWAQDYHQIQPSPALNVGPLPLPQPASSAKVRSNSDQLQAPLQVQNKLNLEVEVDKSAEEIAIPPTPTNDKAEVSPGSSVVMLDRAINKVYHRQKLAMLVPLAIKLRQIKGGEIKVADLDEGYLGLLKEFNQQATSLSEATLTQFGLVVGLGERDLVRLLWLREDFNKIQALV